MVEEVEISSFPDCLNSDISLLLFSELLISGHQIWTRIYTIGSLALRALNYSTQFPVSLACTWQVRGLPQALNCYNKSYIIPYYKSLLLVLLLGRKLSIDTMYPKD